MNKTECKKYLRRAFNNIKRQNKSITIENLEIEMRKQINKDAETYIDCGKIALNNLLNSANDISAADLSEQIDVVTQIYDERQLIIQASKL